MVRKPDGEGHAVLTVRTDDGDYILDNLSDAVQALGSDRLPLPQAPGHQPIRAAGCRSATATPRWSAPFSKPRCGRADERLGHSSIGITLDRKPGDPQSLFQFRVDGSVSQADLVHWPRRNPRTDAVKHHATGLRSF